jgi:hypothetical protein
MALDEPEAEDKIIRVNEIQVAIEPNIIDHTNDVILDFDEKDQRIVFKRNQTEYC